MKKKKECRQTQLVIERMSLWRSDLGMEDNKESKVLAQMHENKYVSIWLSKVKLSNQDFVVFFSFGLSSV